MKPRTCKIVDITFKRGRNNEPLSYFEICFLPIGYAKVKTICMSPYSLYKIMESFDLYCHRDLLSRKCKLEMSKENGVRIRKLRSKTWLQLGK